VDSCVDQRCVNEVVPGCGGEGFVSRDQDNDGVPNWEDYCPDTLPGTLVDGRGCPLQPPTPATGKGGRRYIYQADSGASVGRGAGSPCGAVGLIAPMLALTGLWLMRVSRRLVPSPPRRVK